MTKKYYRRCKGCETPLTAEQWFVVCLTGCPVCEDIAKEAEQRAAGGRRYEALSPVDVE
jgi:hypothetical protein